MKTKVLYTLVSDDTDSYLEQALLSVYSLRLYNPNVYVGLVVDAGTKKSLVGNRSIVYKYFSEVIDVPIPIQYGKMQRSRFLKTNLRNLVDGDFLFIDCDTVICGSLDKIDDFEGDIGGLLDAMAPYVSTKYPYWEDVVRTVGWWNDLNGVPIYNSGVLFVRDNERTRSFYAQWFEKWKYCGENFNIYKDQLPLCKVYSENEGVITSLKPEWHCQVKGENFTSIPIDTKIIHYYASQDKMKFYFYDIEKDSLLARVKLSSDIPDDIKKVLQTPLSLFKEKKIVIHGNQFEFMQSGMYEIYQDYPSFFRILLSLGSFYRTIVTYLYNLKHTIFLH